MRPCLVNIFAANIIPLLVLASAGPRGPGKLQRETPDMVKIYEAFPSAIAVMDIDNDSILDCLTARRTEMDPDTKSATYVWSLLDKDGKARSVSAANYQICPALSTLMMFEPSSNGQWPATAHDLQENPVSNRVPVYHWAGDEPGATRFTVGSKNGTVEVGHFRYSDYQNCTVLEMPHFGDQCTLWVSESVRDSIPDTCLKQYADICGNGVSLYDKEMCKDYDQ